jgi:cytochrome c oxidase assembly factor CtaG/polyferredoxin
MSPLVEAFLISWPFDPGLLAVLLLTAGIYLHGWLILHWRSPQRWHVGQLSAFFGGLLAIFLALASPIEPFSFLLLQVHMVQHLLLMMAAPPLLWLGDPLFPMLSGLPAPIRTYWLAPLFRSRRLRHFFRWLVHPVPAWLIFVGATWLWHLPVPYETALRSDGWHYVQHLAFFAAGLIFWNPVVRPFPSRPSWSRWLLLPYLLLADIQNTVLAALLTFSDRVLYPYYADMPRLEGLSALDDQATAGVLMWVPGSIAFLLPLFLIGMRSFIPGNPVPKPAAWRPAAKRQTWEVVSESGRVSLPLVDAGPARRTNRLDRWDLLHVPIFGRFLRWRHARLCLQIPLLVLAGVVIYDGLTGPQLAPMNLAGVLPWIHWRGLGILGLLVLGNVFCTACPFLLPRTLARQFLPQYYTWPRWLRNKWLAVLLLGLFLWAYEAFALWDSPWWTAWLAIGYFAGAFVVDSFFKGAAFCKYVCPIGQFNFVQSLMSPWEVKARDPEICTTCKTKDCIRGNSTPGCELHLYVPRKSSNMDCTLCLACIQACPHDNIGIVASTPAAELWHDRFRSGIGRFGNRVDLAALVLILVFGAFANAAGMVAPVAEWQDWLQAQWEQQSPIWVISIYYLFALVLVPLGAVGCAAYLSRWWSSLPDNRFAIATRYVYALVPLGFAMWFSHYSFHLLTSYDVAIPATQRFAGDLGGNLGTSDWVYACCRPVMDWLPRLEILALDLGLLLSLYTAYRIARSCSADLPRALKALTPWAVVIVLLFAVGIWIVLQPMQMRGTIVVAR